MAYTQAQLTLLDNAIAQGALVVEYADKKVTYRTLKEMLEIRQIMSDALGNNGTNSASNGRRYGDFSKGLQ